MPDLIVPQKTLIIVRSYEGLAAGYDPKTKRYYPYHCDADAAGVWTVGQGHKLTHTEISTGCFAGGLTLDEVNNLFNRDMASRQAHLRRCLGATYTTDQFAAALSMFFNNEEAWVSGSPGTFHKLGRYNTAALMMLHYIYSGQKPHLVIQRGLWRRRMTEALCYLTGEVITVGVMDTERALLKKLKVLIPVVVPKEFQE